MNVTELPFNQLVGLEATDPDSELLISLPDDPKYTNHLGTVHASALFAVAEAGSGEFLQRQLGHIEGAVPVVRRVEGKFRKPAKGRVSARASVPSDEVSRWASELANRGRVLAPVTIEVVDADHAVVFSATVVWFISKMDGEGG